MKLTNHNNMRGTSKSMFLLSAPAKALNRVSLLLFLCILCSGIAFGITNQSLESHHVMYHTFQTSAFQDSGNASLGGDYDGTNTGGVLQPGYYGNAINFTNSHPPTDYISIGQFWNPGTGDFAVCSWISYVDSPDNDMAVIFGEGKESIPDWIFGVSETNGDVLRMFIRDSTNSTSAYGTTDLRNAGWQFVCGGRNSTNIWVAVNGTVENMVDSESRNMNNAEVTFIGKDNRNPFPEGGFTGMIDELYVYDIGVSQDQMQYVYETYQYDLELLSPVDEAVMLIGSYDFTYNITSEANDIINCSLLTNITGTQEITQTDTSVDNNSINTFNSISLSTSGRYEWTVQCIDAVGREIEPISPVQFNVSQIKIDDCSAYVNSVLNVTFKNEENSSSVQSTYDGNIIYFNGEGDTTYAFSGTDTDVAFCSNYNITTVDANTSVTFSATNYPERIKDAALILTSNMQEVVHYLLHTNDGVYARFQVVDNFGAPVVGATATQKRVIDSVLQTTSVGTTDSAGLVTMWAGFNEEQTYTFTKANVGTKTITINPTSSDVVTVVLGGTTTVINQSYGTGIEYSFSPTQVLQNNTAYDFSINITSSLWNITSCTLYVKNSTDTLSSSNSSFSNSGCFISISQSTNDYETMTSEVIYQLNGITTKTITRSYSVLYTYEGDYSLKAVLDDVKNFSGAGFNGFTRSFIGFVVILVIIFSLTRVGEGFRDPEVVTAITMILIWIFSWAGFFTIANPQIPTEFLKQYIIALLMTLFGLAYIMKRHTD